MNNVGLCQTIRAGDKPPMAWRLSSDVTRLRTLNQQESDRNGYS